MNFDGARAAHPALAFALYAYEPGGPVTLEVMTAAGETFTFTGNTAQAAIDKAFPPAEPVPDAAASAFD